MGKATYSVVGILPGRRQDYPAFNSGTYVNDKGESLDSGSLSISVMIDANSKADAESKVRVQYPNHSINSAATERLG